MDMDIQVFLLTPDGPETDLAARSLMDTPCVLTLRGNPGAEMVAPKGPHHGPSRLNSVGIFCFRVPLMEDKKVLSKKHCVKRNDGEGVLGEDGRGVRRWVQ